MSLQDIDTGESPFPNAEIDEIDAQASDVIPNYVARILLQSRPELSRPAPANPADKPFSAAPRPGRNAPCSCRSSHQFKQCCGRI